MQNAWDWEFAWEILPELVRGMVTTVSVTLVGIVIAVVLGLFLALGRRFAVLGLRRGRTGFGHAVIVNTRSGIMGRTAVVVICMTDRPVLEPTADHPITIEPTGKHVTVRVNGELVADTRGAGHYGSRLAFDRNGQRR